MSSLDVSPTDYLHDRIRVPNNKSISHQTLMLCSLADGDSHVDDFLPSKNYLTTLGCLRALGVEIERHDETTLTVHERGLRGLRAPSARSSVRRSIVSPASAIAPSSPSSTRSLSRSARSEPTTHVPALVSPL